MSSEARLATLERHLAAENAHDVDAIMGTYVEHPVVVINGKAIDGREQVRAFHQRFGFGGGGSFDQVRVRERHRHVTAEAIVIEQTLSGRHVNDWEGLGPTGRSFEIAVCTVYRFDARGQLASEDVYFDRARLRRALEG